MPTRTLIPNSLPERAEPETFRARTILATLAVKDLQKSLTWYRDKVGFFVDETFHNRGHLDAVTLKAGDITILLRQDDGGTGWDKVKGAGFTLQLTTAQDLDGLAEAIIQRGGSPDGKPQLVSGTRVLRLRDPDGFRLEISAAK
ncbi:MAG TPA: VOC family protein [Gemmatimonadaceae bacterium]|jgi:catechol 2,3-dioxygenase-like lactoylglutathione lyase family enzyme